MKRKALFLCIAAGILISGCGQPQVSVPTESQWNQFRAVEVSAEEQEKNEELLESIERFRQEQEEKAIEEFQNEETLTVEQTLFAPISEEELAEEMYYDGLEKIAVCVEMNANGDKSRMKRFAKKLLAFADKVGIDEAVETYGYDKSVVPSEECYVIVREVLGD